MSPNRLESISMLVNLLTTNRTPDVYGDLGVDRATLAESELVSSVVV